MDSWKFTQTFLEDFIWEYNKATDNDDWEEQAALNREVERVIRELRTVTKSLNTLRMYGYRACK